MIENFCGPHVDDCEPDLMDRQEKKLRRLEMAIAVKNGQPLADVAAKFGVSAALVRGACVENEVEIPKPKREKFTQLREETLHVIADLLAGEKSYEQIAEERGLTKQRVGAIKISAEKAGLFDAAKVSRETLKQRESEVSRLAKEVKQLQVDRRRAGPAASPAVEERHRAIVADVQGGLTAQGAAKKYNLSVGRIYQVLLAAGVEPPEKSKLNVNAMRRYLKIIADIVSGGEAAAVAAKHKTRKETVMRLWAEAKRAKIPGVPG